MTLILNGLGPYSAYQVSDRLVTIRACGNGAKEFDAFSNKTVVFRGADGIISISYTGLAFIRKKPTDQWMAEILSGRVHQGAIAFHSGGNGNWPKISEAVYRLKEEICKEFRRLKMRHRPTSSHGISIVGWHEKKSRLRPISIIIHNKYANHSEFLIKKMSRYYQWDKTYSVCAAPPQSRTFIRSIVSNIEESMPGKDAYFLDTKMVNTLLSALRYKAGLSDVIGADAMAIFIDLKNEPEVTIKYVPKEQEIGGDSATECSGFVYAFSPWVITPNHTMGPTVMQGSGWEFKSGNVKIIVKCPASTVDGIKSRFSSQPRRLF